MNTIITLPDGTKVGTGLQVPLTTRSSFPEYAQAGPMLSMDAIIAAAKTGSHRGRDRFDSSWVKNQRNHGSCQGFMTANMLSKARVRRMGMQNRVDLSGAYAYSLVNGGRDNGSTLDDGMASSERDGICEEKFAGWDQIYPHQYDKQAADANAKLYKSFECYTIRTEQEWGSALVLGFDVGTAVHAANRFMEVDAKGIAGADTGPGNHAVGCDGIWWDGALVGDGMNSWSTSYGDQGRMGLIWGRHFSQTIQYHPFYAMRSTL